MFIKNISKKIFFTLLNILNTDEKYLNKIYIDKNPHYIKFT